MSRARVGAPRRRPTSRPETVVREMRVADMANVLGIERDTYPVPWSRAMFLAELGRRNGLGLVAMEGPDVVGYLMAAEQAGVWHVLNVSVRRPQRGRGVGEALLRALLERAEPQAPSGFTLEVRVSNDPAIRLYRRMGFLDHGVRRGYYSDNGEDALVMWRGGTPEDG